MEILNLIQLTLPWISFPLQLYVIWHGKIGLGKWVTRPMAVRVASYAIRKKNLTLLMACSTPSLFRWRIQVFPALTMLLILLFFYIAGIVHDPYMAIINLLYWAWLTILFGDDLLSNTDKPRKWWNSAKNKIKWRKFAPTPILSPS